MKNVKLAILSTALGLISTLSVGVAVTFPSTAQAWDGYGRICGVYMCCSLAPNGPCWPHGSPRPK